MSAMETEPKQTGSDSSMARALPNPLLDSRLSAPKIHGTNLWKIRTGFALIPFCHAAGMNIITILAFRFLTDNLAISAGAAGFLFALVKIYDGIIDPAIGAWSDRARSPWGRRLPFIFGGGILMPLSIVAIFGAPDFGSVIITQIIVTLALMLHATAYTALTIPGFAMAIEVSDDFNERTSMMSFRIFGNSLGMLAGTALPAILLGIWGASRTGHLKMALVIGSLILIGSMLSVWLLRHAPRTDPAQEKVPKSRYNIKDQLVLVWKNAPFRVLAITHIFVLFAVSVSGATSAYFSKYVLGFPDSWLGYFYVALAIGSIFSLPVWVYLSRILSKKVAYMMAMALYGSIHLAWLSASEAESSILLITRALVSGVSVGGVILCAYSMMTDAVRYDYITSGLRREGAFAGFTTLLDKLSAALAVALMGGLLGWMGYVSSYSAAAVQPASALLAIKLCVAVVPAISMVIAIVAVWSYSLDEDMLREPEK